MNKQEALAKLEELRKTVSCADDIDSVSWSHDILPVRTLAADLRILQNDDIFNALVKLHLGLMHDAELGGIRRGITWAQVYDLFQAMEKGIEAMP